MGPVADGAAVGDTVRCHFGTVGPTVDDVDAVDVVSGRAEDRVRGRLVLTGPVIQVIATPAL